MGRNRSRKIVDQGSVEIDVDGIRYEGRYTISGTRSLRLEVEFDHRIHSDDHDYPPDSVDAVRAMAGQLLWEMVTGRSISSRYRARK